MHMADHSVRAYMGRPLSYLYRLPSLHPPSLCHMTIFLPLSSHSFFLLPILLLSSILILLSSSFSPRSFHCSTLHPDPCPSFPVPQPFLSPPNSLNHGRIYSLIEPGKIVSLQLSSSSRVFHMTSVKGALEAHNTENGCQQGSEIDNKKQTSWVSYCYVLLLNKVSGLA